MRGARMKDYNERKREVFAMAVERLGIRPTDAPAVFDVSRQTFFRWTTGAARVPDRVFVQLVSIDNKEWARLKEREDDIKALVERLNSSGLS